MASMSTMTTTLPSRQFSKRVVCSASSSSRGDIQARFLGFNASIAFKKLLLVTPSQRFMNMSYSYEEPTLSFSRIRCAAAAAGLEASIGTDAQESDIKVKNATIEVVSQDEQKIQLRVDVTGAETDKVFNLVLRNLASTAPPIPGFRRQKGGKTTQVPKDFLLNVLGEERVTKFVIQEIVSTTVAEYVKKEGLIVKENKLNTTQTLEELQKSFSPGKEFGFNADLELDKEVDDDDDDDDTEALQESDIIDVTVASDV